MSAVDDYLSTLDTTGDTYPADIIAGFTAAHTSDLGISAGKITTLETAIAELTVENAELKAIMFDMSRAASATAESDEDPDNPPANDDDEPADIFEDKDYK